MRREFVVRLKISRPVARAAVIGFILGFPCSPLSPASRTVTETVTAGVPSPNATFIHYRSYGKTVIGQGTSDVLITSGQDCYPQAITMNNEWVKEVALGYPAAPPPTTCASGSIRRMTVMGPAQNNIGIYDHNDILMSAKNPVKLYVQGDVWARQLCWYDGKCIKQWYPEPGPLYATNAAGAASCDPPNEFTNCFANQTLFSTMHLQYMISNTTNTGKNYALYFGFESVTGCAAPATCSASYEFTRDSTRPRAPDSSRLTAKDCAAGLGCFGYPTAGKGDITYYYGNRALSSSAPNFQPSSAWGRFLSGTDFQMDYLCGYTYVGNNSVLDCFLVFPKSHTYALYFDARDY